MRVLLDTVTFIRALISPEHLSKRAVAVLYDPDIQCDLSAISVAEIAIKFSVGKLDMDASAVRDGIVDLQLRSLSWRAEHAFRLYGLARHHADPFDRQLIAQALEEDVAVVTPDVKFRQYRGVRVIW